MFSSKLPTQAGVLENKPEARPGAERKNAPCILACRTGILKSLYSRQCRRNVLSCCHRAEKILDRNYGKQTRIKQKSSRPLSPLWAARARGGCGGNPEARTNSTRPVDSLAHRH